MKQRLGRVTILAVALYATIAFLSGCASLPSTLTEAPKKTVSRKPSRSLFQAEILAELKSVSPDVSQPASAASTEKEVKGASKATVAKTKTAVTEEGAANENEENEAKATKIVSVDKQEPASGGEARKAAMAEGPMLASRSSNEMTSEATDEASPDASPIEFKRLSMPDSSQMNLSSSSEAPLIFDIPVTYNDRVRNWIRYFQTTGRDSFRRWLERSARYHPLIQYELTQAGLPQDLVYVAMIESGFSNSAVSHANAMGMWQFIAPTGRRYGLRIDWWIDERKDFSKATKAAIRYMQDLYSQFNSWYLVAASYNMGENGVRRLIKKYGTNNFWELADLGALPRETRDYVPKILAATLISKAPALYGFRDLEHQMPLSYEVISVPGGIDLINLAGYLGVSEKYLKELNPELTKGFIPRYIASHKIRVPKGSTTTVSQYVRMQGNNAAN